MEGEQFSLCWNNFHNNLTSGFHSLLKDEDLVDVTLAADGKFLKAHRTVLSVCSPFFKELFRVNPCDHPIVILPDVSYRALRSLLNFMYKGEVSVSQEEIPTFMRVAEMLKVKGLTDNSSSPPSDTNGFSNANRNFNLADQRQNIMKRPRPVKKLIRPIQHLRPIESPKLERIQQSRESHVSQHPPLKRPSLDNEHMPATSQVKLEEPMIKPKEEPIDPNDEENTSHSGEDSQMDVTNMLDTTLGEPSPSHPFPGWPAADVPPPPPTPQDTSQPGLTLLKSARGQLVLIYNGHMYTLCDKKDIRMLWVCVKKKTLNCPGFITTISGPSLLTATEHNHPEIHDVIKKLQVPSCSISPELKKL